MRTLEATLPQTAAVYPDRTIWLMGLCFVFSGATGLIYEVLWARMLGLVFGATTLAVSTVLAAFMGGLALGSAMAGRLAERIKRPFRVYGLLEAGIAIYAILVPVLFSGVDNLYALIWQHFHPGFFAFSLWRFALSCLMLLVPTTLMGATLPVLSAALVRSPTYQPNSVARLYTCNLVGAITGALAAGFLLLPSFGVRSTIYIAAAINLIIGLLAVLGDRASGESEGFEERFSVSRTSDIETRLRPDSISTESDQKRFWFFCALVSGFVTISTQVAWTRVLSMIIGSSTYAFSIVVALFLIGLSAGAWAIGRKNLSERLRATVLKAELATAVSLFLSLQIINLVPAWLVNIGLRLKVSSWAGLLALQIFAAALLVLVPAFLMGTVMPLVLVWAGKRHPASVQLVGRSYAINTIGAILGAFTAGFILIPRASTKLTILFAAALCMIVVGLAYEPGSDAKDPALRRSFVIGAIPLAILALFLFSPRMNLADLSIGAYDSLVRILAGSRGGERSEPGSAEAPETHLLLMYAEGPTSTVSVRKDWGITSMAINGRTNASDRDDMPTQVMVGQLPLLLAPNLKTGLVVGFATGVSAGAMLQSPLESLECVELEPETVKGSHYFDHVNNRPLSDPRLHLIIDDARTYLRVTPARYDVIVSEPSHPWVPGVANLFTEEFFQLGRARLSDEGVFVQWLQIYQLSTGSLRSVLATYQRVFPHVMVFRVGGATKGKDLILVGSNKPLTLQRISERMRDQRIAAELARIEIKSEGDVRSWYVCDESQLAPAVAGSIINTDDNMHIETTVPREAFRPLMQTNGAWIESLAAKK